MKPDFPAIVTTEFLLVDLVNNLKRLVASFWAANFVQKAVERCIIAGETISAFARSGVVRTFCLDVSRSRSSDLPNNRNTP